MRARAAGRVGSARVGKSAHPGVEDVARRGKTCSTRPSLVFPDRGTTRARAGLTSLFEWEAVTLDDVLDLQLDRQGSAVFVGE